MNRARKRTAAFITAALLALFVGGAVAGNFEQRTFVLFGGSDTDSLEQVSPWIPVKGATRVTLRTWSTHLAGGINADTTFTDSIAVFKVGFSDSVSGFIVGPSGQNYPVAQDSVVITSTVVVNADTSTKMVVVAYPPLQEQLRSPANGSGIMTMILPASAGVNAASQPLADNNGYIMPQYMRVYVTPTRRNTAGGQLSTQGKRTNGLRGLRMQATVTWANH